MGEGWHESRFKGGMGYRLHGWGRAVMSSMPLLKHQGRAPALAVYVQTSFIAKHACVLPW